ncbi:hypothetical protein BGX38DRAFT_1246994 [Terfezia claveryi]|nr:hypothetical protein BGX38DRAFT_1246994 [Terfezia claveryi]
MGGYRGSILREASGQKRRVWIPLRVGLNLRKVNLEIGLNDEDEETMSQRIIPDGMLTNIGPVDIGRKLLRRLRSGEGVGGRKHPRRVYEYGYDWRLSPHILSRQLIEYLENLPCNQGSDHGQPRQPGRVRHAINQRPELFSGVLFVGTPQQCVNILGPLRNGDTVLLSSRVLTAQVNFTLRSSYKDQHGFFDVNTWIKYALSPCVVTVKSASSLPSMNGVIEEAVKDAARESVAPEASPVPIIHCDEITSIDSLATVTPTSPLATVPRASMEEHKSVYYPPMAIIYANNTPTVKGARVDGIESISLHNVYDDLIFGAGKRCVCLAKAAQLPPGYKACAKVLSDRGHISLLGDLDNVGKAIEGIVRERGGKER